LKSKPSLKLFRGNHQLPKPKPSHLVSWQIFQTKTETGGLVSNQTEFGLVWNQTSPTLAPMCSLKISNP
jgi:hypothetical protein